jgi:ABC-type Na+ efflux pump permease subunit
MIDQFIIPIYTSLCLFHSFAFVLGLAHSYDVDEETRAAPLTWWWFIFIAGALLAVSVLAIYGVFVGGIIEKQPVWTSTPLEFHTIVVFAMFLSTPATYRLGWLSGLALQHRIPPIAFVKLPIEIPVPAVVIVRREVAERRERRRRKTNSVLDLLKVSMR